MSRRDETEPPDLLGGLRDPRLIPKLGEVPETKEEIRRRKVVRISSAVAAVVAIAVAAYVGLALSHSASIREAQVNERTVHLSGSAAPGGVVYVWVDGNLLETTTADSGGSWNVSLDLPPGEHEVKVSSSKNRRSFSEPLVVTVPTGRAAPESGGGFAYVVKEDDWLTKLAREYLGSEDRYREIREATNARARTDPSFATIEDDNLIYPGEKIWIPAR